MSNTRLTSSKFRWAIPVLIVSMLSFLLISCSSSDQTVLNGAGASFPAPLYQSWFVKYHESHPDILISYQSIGSGAGVRQFNQETVDFGASDVGMTNKEANQVSRGVTMVPVTAGGIVMGYNLPGVDNLKISREILIEIYQGKITSWKDSKITSLNPSQNIPDMPITVLYRSDGSGTTAVFTKHLTHISDDWKQGQGKSIAWSTGVGAKGNEGITAMLLQTPGAFGYIEYGFAKQNKINHALLENNAGNYIAYSSASASEALSNIQLPGNLLAFEPDPDGANSYPIVTYSWLLVYNKYDDPKQATAIKEMLIWVVTEGQKSSEQLGYIPLPQSTVNKLLPAINQIGK